MTQSSEHDTTLDKAKPIQVSPHFHDRTNDDAFTRAHVNADTDSGASALHHTLGHAGGAASFEHKHESGTKNPNVGNASTPSPSFGSTGHLRVAWEKINTQLVYLELDILFNGTGMGWPAGAGISILDNIFFRTNKILPVTKSIAIPFAASLSGGLDVRHGMAIADDFNWSLLLMWATGTSTMSTGITLTGSVSPGDYISGSGLYRYA